MEGGVDIFQGRRSDGGRTDGKAEAVGLVEVVVRILAEDYGFDSWERGVAGPFFWWESVVSKECIRIEEKGETVR